LRDKQGEVVGFAIVDAEDYERIVQHRWYRKEPMPGYFVAVRNVPRESHRRGRPAQVRMHREVLGLPSGSSPSVDHISRDPLDNRKSNLRLATHAQNRQNTKGWDNVTSKYRGVSWDESRGKWKAQARLNYKAVTIGRFDSEQEAAEAARAWRAEHMPFALD
jgi:hypothetical protein